MKKIFKILVTIFLPLMAAMTIFGCGENSGEWQGRSLEDKDLSFTMSIESSDDVSVSGSGGEADIDIIGAPLTSESISVKVQE